MKLERWIGAVIVLMSVLMVIYTAVHTARMNDAIDCQADYNEAYSHALIERAEAARRERHAQRDLLEIVLSPDITEQQIRAAFDKYLGVLDAADEQRSEATLPSRHC